MKDTKVIFRIMLLAVVLLASGAAWGEQVYTPADVPNPNIADRSQYVADPGGFMSPEAKAEVNRQLAEVRKATTAEIAVAILPSIGDETVDEFAPELFKQWGLGKTDKDNGMLLLIDMGGKKARIETGYGMEGVFTDAFCSELLRGDLFPRMKENDVDGGVKAVIAHISAVATNPEVRDEIMSELADGQAGLTEEDIETLKEVAWNLAMIVLFAGLCIFVYKAVKTRGKDRYEKALAWRGSLVMLGGAALFSLGMALPLFLLAYIFYRRSRNKRLRCPKCGKKMRRLSEEADNAYLTPAEDLEEQIKSVDYDVWECPACHAIEKYAYRSSQTKFAECPACKTVAYEMVSDEVRVKPTLLSQGTGVKTYKCRFCGHTKEEQYKIPRLEAAAAAAGAAAAIGSSLSDSGSSGGGFSGGSSGGGGASGGW